MMATATTSRPKNGSDALATVLESLPLIVCRTNSVNPTGRETSAVSTTSTTRLTPTGGDPSAISTKRTTKIPNQIRLNPACLIIGMTIVVVSTIIEMPSSAVPSTMYMTVSAAISA